MSEYCQSVDHQPRKALWILMLEKEYPTKLCAECFERRKDEFKNRLAYRLQTRQTSKMEMVV